MDYVPDAIFWFAVVGSGAACLKHLLAPVATLQELSPVAIRQEGSKGSKTASPEALWWGGYAFSAMNAGYCTIGLYAGCTNSAPGKAGFLLGTGVLFEAFAAAWFLRGKMTGKKGHVQQGVKIALMGALFLAGFAGFVGKPN